MYIGSYFKPLIGLCTLCFPVKRLEKFKSPDFGLVEEVDYRVQFELIFFIRSL